MKSRNLKLVGVMFCLLVPINPAKRPHAPEPTIGDDA